MASSVFKTPRQIDKDINSQEDFDIGRFSGSDKLLQLDDYNKCLIAFDEENDYISELYYFIEENGELKETEDNLNLYELDETKIVLIELFDQIAIIIRKIDKNEIENFL